MAVHAETNPGVRSTRSFTAIAAIRRVESGGQLAMTPIDAAQPEPTETLGRVGGVGLHTHLHDCLC